MGFRSNWPLTLAGYALAAIVFDVIEKAPEGAFSLYRGRLAADFFHFLLGNYSV